ncbi:hypothetical protein Tco_0626058 [Tanacetum coccineum]|uniref:Retrotransposon gag domain-containing protein n=1 Tax=Tanacetum coccineum TaxID=301880 RepID=A0ABQ4WJA9_9ASTR
MINGKTTYELKEKFLDDLRNNAFNGTNGENAVEHIENFLKIVDPLDLPNVSYERLRLAVFPISLTGDASEWLMNEPQSSITTWVDLTELFFGKYYPPSRTGKIVRTKAKWDSTNVVFENWLDLKYGNLKEEALKQKAMNERSWGDATQKVINFCAWLKRCFGNFHELDYELLVKLEEYWWKMNDHEYVSRTFNNHTGRNEEEPIREERKPNDDHVIGNFDNDLVWDNAPYHANEEEDQYEEDRCELLGNPRQEPSVCKIGRFEVIKYSFGPTEKYISIKECEHDDWTRTEEDSCNAYQ